MLPRHAYAQSRSGSALHRVLLPERHRSAEMESGGGRPRRGESSGVSAGSERLRRRGHMARRAGAGPGHRGRHGHRPFRRVHRHSHAVDGAVGAQGRGQQLHAARADARSIPGRPHPSANAPPQPRALGDGQHRHRSGEHFVSHRRAGRDGDARSQGRLHHAVQRRHRRRRVGGRKGAAAQAQRAQPGARGRDAAQRASRCRRSNARRPIFPGRLRARKAGGDRASFDLHGAGGSRRRAATGTARPNSSSTSPCWRWPAISRAS